MGGWLLFMAHHGGGGQVPLGEVVEARELTRIANGRIALRIADARSTSRIAAPRQI